MRRDSGAFWFYPPVTTSDRIITIVHHPGLVLLPVLLLLLFAVVEKYQQLIHMHPSVLEHTRPVSLTCALDLLPLLTCTQHVVLNDSNCDDGCLQAKTLCCENLKFPSNTGSLSTKFFTSFKYSKVYSQSFLSPLQKDPKSCGQALRCISGNTNLAR